MKSEQPMAILAHILSILQLRLSPSRLQLMLFMFLSVDFVVNFMSGDLPATLEQELGSIAALFTSCVILKILMKILTNMS